MHRVLIYYIHPYKKGDQILNTTPTKYLNNVDDDFKEKAILFANDAEQFYNLAQQVSTNAGLTNIKSYFQNDASSGKLAPKFNAAAEQLHTAFNGFKDALETPSKRNCDTVRGEVGTFTVQSAKSNDSNILNTIQAQFDTTTTSAAKYFYDALKDIRNSLYHIL